MLQCGVMPLLRSLVGLGHRVTINMALLTELAMPSAAVGEKLILLAIRDMAEVQFFAKKPPILCEKHENRRKALWPEDEEENEAEAEAEAEQEQEARRLTRRRK